MNARTIRLRGNRFCLLAEGALHGQKEKTLVIAEGKLLQAVWG